MNSKEELQGFLALVRAMSGEENVLENMEAEGQQEVVRKTLMAKDMRPRKEVWEQLGFTFEDIPNDRVLCNATLPEGWSIQATEHAMWNNILDQNGTVRGKMFYKAAFYDRSANMYLQCRYQVCTNYIGKDYSITEIYFGNDTEKLFVAGTISKNLNASREARLRFYDEEEKLKQQATNWAKENYPDYEDVTAYWNLPIKKDSKSKSKHQ